MEAVYVLEPGTYIRREGNTLKVIKGERVLEQIPIFTVRQFLEFLEKQETP